MPKNPPSRSKRGASSGGGRAAPPAPPASAARLAHEWLVAGLFMALAICLLYPDIVLHDRVFFAGDKQAAVAFAAAGRQAMEAGEYPLWNPWLFSGMPSFASLAYTPWVYPVTYLAGPLVRWLHFPHLTWLLMHTWLMGLGVYALLRDRGVHWTAAMTAGAAMMWMPNLVAVGAYGHGSQAIASAWIPLALLFTDRVRRGVAPVSNAAALALVLGLSLLRAHLQIAYYTFLLVGMHWFYFSVAGLVDAWRRRGASESLAPRWRTGAWTPARAAREALEAAGVVAVVTGLALAIGAVLHVPVHEYARYSIRGASGGGLDYGYATSWSLHPAEMLTFVLPYAFGFGKDLYFGHMPFTDYPNYLGILVVLCAVWAGVRARSRFVGFLVAVSVFTTFVSFGRFLPVVYDPMFQWMPYFDKFRVPVMILIVQQICVVTLAGIGLDALLREAPERGRRVAVWGLTATFVVFMLVVLTQGVWTGEFASSVARRIRSVADPQQKLMVARVAGTYMRNDLMRLALVLAGAFTVLFVHFNTWRGRRPVAAAALLAALVLFDFHLVDRNIIHPEKFRHVDAWRIVYDRSEVRDWEEPDSVVTFLQHQDGPFRVLPVDAPQRPFGAMFASNRYMIFGIGSVGGYHAAKLAHYDTYLRVMGAMLVRGRLELADLLNARWIVAGAPLPAAWPGLEEAWTGRDGEGRAVRIYENARAMPRAWVTGRYRVAQGEDALRMLVGGIDVRREVVLDRRPGAKVDPNATGEAEIVDWGIHRIDVRVRTDAPAILVTSEVYYPEWRVTVDGQAAELLRADTILRAVAVPAGEHEVVFTYAGHAVRKWARVSIGTGVLMILVILGDTVRRRRAAA